MTILTAGKQRRAYPLIWWPSGNRSKISSQMKHSILVTAAAAAAHHQHPPSLSHGLSPQQSEQQLFHISCVPGQCPGLLLGYKGSHDTHFLVYIGCARQDAFTAL